MLEMLVLSLVVMAKKAWADMGCYWSCSGRSNFSKEGITLALVDICHV